jgi:hypothetical protein
MRGLKPICSPSVMYLEISWRFSLNGMAQPFRPKSRILADISRRRANLA